MATIKKGTFTPPPEWWKHMRPFNKRKISKRERLAARRDIDRRRADAG